MSDSKKKKTQVAPRLAHFVLCDEMRLEAGTNKPILVGVWNRIIVTREVPFRARTLTFVFSLIVAEAPVSTFTFSFTGPEGPVVGPFGARFHRPRGDRSVNLAIVTENLALQAGDYTASLIVGNARFNEDFTVEMNPALVDEIATSNREEMLEATPASG